MPRRELPRGPQENGGGSFQLHVGIREDFLAAAAPVLSRRSHRPHRQHLPTPRLLQAPSGRGCAVRHTRHTPVQEALTPSCATGPRSPRDSASERVEVAHARSRQHYTRFGQDCTELAASSPSERLERENAETNGERWESETPGTGPRAKIKARKSH